MATVSIVPTMTTNTAPSPYVASANSENAGTYLAFKAFDANDATYWLTSHLATTGWLKIDLGVSHRVIKYRMQRIGTIVNPKNWTFEGSATGAFAGEETVLDTQTGVTSNGAWVDYSFNNTTAYRYYRLNITLNNGGDEVGLNGFELHRNPATAQIIWVD
jgi:hypothetical protein